LLDGAEAVSIALQHHLTGVLSCRLSEPRLPDLGPLLRAASPGREQVRRTVETYLEAVRLLKAYLAGRGVDLAEADRAQIEAFLADLLARWKPATAANRYRSLKVFYAWLEEEGEISADPMAKMKPPAIPEQPIPIVPDEALGRLFAACAGKDFEARRDTAMIMLLLDSGAHRAEHRLDPISVKGRAAPAAQP
jgi:site-specific recombinase XerD